MRKNLCLPSLLLSFVVLLKVAEGHDKYLGKCPDFKPMDPFNWDKFAGRWYAVEKFDTSSRCLTYDFDEDELGEREIVQTSEISSLKKLTVHNKVKYTGQLTFPRSTLQSDMIVKFPLSVLGSAEYVLMDTDYDNYAMLCTCQSSKFIFDIFTWHRRSCTILQRSPERSEEWTDKMHQLLNQQVGGSQEDDHDKPDHDFDIVQQDSRCNYEDNGKGLNIDVDKILESTQDEIGDTIKATVEEIDTVFFKKFADKSEDEDRQDELFSEPIKDETNNINRKTQNPRV